MKQEYPKPTLGSQRPIDSLDVGSRLKELARLQEGWLNGEGHALSKKGLLRLGKSFDASFDADLPLPFLYPTPGGGVQAEWTVNDWAVTLEIDLATFQSEYQALNLKNNFCDERTLDLSVPDGWTQLNSALKQLQKQTAGARSIAS
ncbi:MAG TPA: hypothetical protein VF865_11460 [Acidobacteriaceae bacterium]